LPKATQSPFLGLGIVVVIDQAMPDLGGFEGSVVAFLGAYWRSAFT
jgi:hypothetical protein